MNCDGTQLLADLERDEGWRPYAYRDSEGFLTIGFGFLVDPNKPGGLPKDIGRAWMMRIVSERAQELGRRLPWVCEQPEHVQRALLNMSYQLGVQGLLQFRKMLRALAEGRYEDAQREALDSKWAEQTPSRAQRIADMLHS